MAGGYDKFLISFHPAWSKKSWSWKQASLAGDLNLSIKIVTN